jgi:hypothetical protein
MPVMKHLQLFSPYELMGLLQVLNSHLPDTLLLHWRHCAQGQQYLTSGDVLSRLKFENFPSSSKTPTFFCNFIKSLDSTKLKRLYLNLHHQYYQVDINVSFRLLCYITASTSLPPSVVIRQCGERGTYPVSHTCFNRLDLPDYNVERQVLMSHWLLLLNRWFWFNNTGGGKGYVLHRSLGRCRLWLSVARPHTMTDIS